MRAWFDAAEADVFATAHTCLPFLQFFGDGLVANNGAAGLASFEGDGAGLVTRVAARGGVVISISATRSPFRLNAGVALVPTPRERTSSRTPRFYSKRTHVVSDASQVPGAPPSALGPRLYGTTLGGGATVDAVPVRFDAAAFLRWFDHAWPPGSAAAVSYRQRAETGAAGWTPGLANRT